MFPFMAFPTHPAAPVPLPITMEVSDLLPVGPIALVPIAFAIVACVVLSVARKATREHEEMARLRGENGAEPAAVPQVA